MHFLVTITLSLFVVFLFSEIFYRFKFPIVVAQIIAGIFIGFPFVRNFLIGENIGLITLLANLGIIFLLFLAGLEVEWNRLYGVRKDIFLIAIFGAITPFLLGFFTLKLMGYSTVIALVTGICLSITSEGTKARVLMELKKLRTRLGTTMIGAGIVDDSLGLLLFTATIVFFDHKIIPATFLYKPLEIIGFMAVIWVTFKFLPKLIKFEERETKQMREISLFTTVLLLCLAFALFGEYITGTETGSVIAAFIAGIAIQLSLKRKEEKTIRSHFEIMSLAFIVPFFFIGVGLNFNLNELILNWPLLIIITIIAIAGKLIGAFLTKPFTKLTFKQLHLIGWGMNSRGAVELVIALLALKAGLLPLSIYSSIVLMTLITTLSFPFILRIMLKKYPGIMG